MSVRLFVGNLPYSATETEVREHFASVGPVVSVSLPTDRETGRPRGFAFVEYADRALAEEAIRRFHNKPLGGRPISVNEARPPERGAPRRDMRPPGPGGFVSRPPSPGGGPPRPPSGDRPFGDRPFGDRPFGDRPPSSGPPRPQRPRESFGDGDPAADLDRGERRRAVGGPARRTTKKKGAKGGRERERAPKGPIPAKTTGRFYGPDADESEEDYLGNDLEEIEDADDELDELDDELDEGDDGEGAEEGDDANDTAEERGSKESE